MNQEITSVYNIYHNDMNFIITDFYKYLKLSDFVEVMNIIKQHANADAIVIFNYRINKDEDGLLQFLFDIDECIESIENFDDEKSQYLKVDRFDKSDTKALTQRIRNFKTLIKTKSTIEKSTNKTKHQIMKLDNYNVYLYDPHPVENDKLYNYIRDYGISNYKQLANENDFLLPILKVLSRQMSFDMKISYPYEDAKFQEKLNFDRQVSDAFDKQIDYGNFVSIEMRI